MNDGTPDGTDVRILKQLQADSRTSHGLIADRLGLEESEVAQRVETLEEEGVIASYTILTDPKKLGYISVAFGVTTDPNKTDEIARQLRDHDNVYKIWILSGRHNIIIHASFEDIEDFQEFSHDTLHNVDGIVQYESSIVTQSVISEGSVVLSPDDD